MHFLEWGASFVLFSCGTWVNASHPNMRSRSYLGCVPDHSACGTWSLMALDGRDLWSIQSSIPLPPRIPALVLRVRALLSIFLELSGWSIQLHHFASRCSERFVDAGSLFWTGTWRRLWRCTLLRCLIGDFSPYGLIGFQLPLSTDRKAHAIVKIFGNSVKITWKWQLNIKLCEYEVWEEEKNKIMRYPT